MLEKARSNVLSLFVATAVAVVLLVLAFAGGAIAGSSQPEVGVLGTADALAPADLRDPWVARVDESADPEQEDEVDVQDGKGQHDTFDPESTFETRLSDLACEEGYAGPFPCDDVDLLSFVPNAEMAAVNANDHWGWTDPETGREYVLVGTGYNTTYVDITEPTDPVVVGYTPAESPQRLPLWRDVKVYEDHAYIVSEQPEHGMQVVDLTRLRDVGVVPAVLLPDTTYHRFSRAHNIAINEDSGFAYVVGAGGGEDCDGGLHMVDVREPQEPTFAGCFADDGYTHDVQCVIYHGKDGSYRGREICFASNEDTLTIVDVTDKDDPVLLSRTGYDTAAYTHQGWLTPDHEWFLFGDELDELNGTVSDTTTYIMDVSKLGSPGTPVPYFHDTEAIDHNLYIEDRFVYQANYSAGLRVLSYDKHTLREGELDPVAYFDVLPHIDAPVFAGAWSNYPFFESGVVTVTTIEGGLFVLEPNLPEDPPNRQGQGPRARE